MSDGDNTQDGKAMSPASAGSVASIDAHELMRELHHIAGSEQHDPDVRRTACEAESAIGLLAEWVNKLQIDAVERITLERLSDARFRTHGISLTAADSDTLRALLERHK